MSLSGYFIYFQYILSARNLDLGIVDLNHPGLSDIKLSRRFSLFMLMHPHLFHQLYQVHINIHFSLHINKKSNLKSVVWPT